MIPDHKVQNEARVIINKKLNMKLKEQYSNGRHSTINYKHRTELRLVKQIQHKLTDNKSIVTKDDTLINLLLFYIMSPLKRKDTILSYLMLNVKQSN